MESSVNHLIPNLQVAIGPVIFISGVGLLLLTMTNRFARIIDRTRSLAALLPEASEDNRARTAHQIEILYHRVRIMRRAITFSTASVFFVSVLMLVLFVGALMHLDWAILVTALFAGALLCLTIGLALFIYDFRLSLIALDLELGRKRPNV